MRKSGADRDEAMQSETHLEGKKDMKEADKGKRKGRKKRGHCK